MLNRQLTKFIFIAFTYCTLFISPAVSANETMDTWRKAVMTMIAKNQRYPRSAVSREIEGNARVRLNITADGTITSHEIVSDTGETVLDREIPKLIDRLNPLPALPSGKDMSIVIPLTWSLD